MAEQQSEPGNLPRHICPLPPSLVVITSTFIPLVQNLQRLEMNDRLKEIDVPRVLRIQQVEDMIEKHYLPIPICYVIESFQDNHIS